MNTELEISPAKILAELDLSINLLNASWQLRNGQPSTTSHFRAGKAHQTLRRLREQFIVFLEQAQNADPADAQVKARAAALQSIQDLATARATVVADPVIARVKRPYNLRKPPEAPIATETPA